VPARNTGAISKWFAGGIASLVLVLGVLLAVEFMKRGMVA